MADLPLTSLLHPILPASKDKPILWQDLSGCGDALALDRAIEADRHLYVVVTPDTQTAVLLEHEIHFFSRVIKRSSMKRFHKKGERTAPCGVDRLSFERANPEPYFS